jgi:hypothetical protein
MIYDLSEGIQSSNLRRGRINAKTDTVYAFCFQEKSLAASILHSKEQHRLSANLNRPRIEDRTDIAQFGKIADDIAARDKRILIGSKHL